jgi:repressor LexA
MNEKPLSKRQQSILQFTHGYMEEHGRPPTIREIGKAVGINSTSVVNYNLGKLEEKGLSRPRPRRLARPAPDE